MKRDEHFLSYEELYEAYQNCYDCMCVWENNFTDLKKKFTRLEKFCAELKQNIANGDVNSLQADLEQARIFIKALDVTKLVAERDSLSRQNEELIAEVEDYKEKYCKWHNFTQDICTVFGDSTYTYVAMEGWLKKMCDAEVLDRYLALADDVCKRLLKVKPHEWEDPVCKKSKSLCSF